MKVFLDDERPAPDGWIPARWPDDVIILLLTGKVTELSLDHDLGNDKHGTGYDVLVWLERQVIMHGFHPPICYVHSANPAARIRMEQAIQKIEQHRHKQGNRDG